MTEFPPPEAVRQMSKAHGYLALDLFAILTFPTRDFAPIAATLKDHLAYWENEEQLGRLVAAGPTLPEENDSPYKGAGIIVIRCASLEEAREVAVADPMHRTGARQFHLVPWLLNHFASPVSHTTT